MTKNMNANKILYINDSGDYISDPNNDDSN